MTAVFTPAFAALSKLVIKITGCQIRLEAPDREHWEFLDRTFIVPINDVEGLIHELCHWIVCPRNLRNEDNYGLGARTVEDTLPEEWRCGWIADFLYAKADVNRPWSSVDENGYDRHDEERLPARRRLRRELSGQERAALVSILQMDGGSLGGFPEDDNTQDGDDTEEAAASGAAILGAALIDGDADD